MTITEGYNYTGWNNCIKLDNNEIELIVTTDIGPRIIRFAFKEGQNLFKEFSDQIETTGGDETKLEPLY
ncbi:hypothetical protein ACFLQQ_00035 [Actinomycetota bacterium]